MRLCAGRGREGEVVFPHLPLIGASLKSDRKKWGWREKRTRALEVGVFWIIERKNKKKGEGKGKVFC